MHGLSKRETALKLGVSEVTVQTWTDRFRTQGLNGLEDRKGRGRKPTISDAIREQIITQATHPPKGLSRHSTRTMARTVGVSQHTVRLIWNANRIKPHLIRTFKVSRDPDFVPTFWDVIGLFLNPPENSAVFCCDEKTQCQALERTQPGLPLNKGHIGTRSHDYIRHGTTTLFSALEYVTGNIIHNHHQKHTHEEWLSFLKKIDNSTPEDIDIHIILDNYATHKHKIVREWLAAHPRFKMHYTPTSSSWLNLVERFFGEITRDCIRDGSFTSVAELEKVIDEYIANHTKSPKRFVWHAQGEEILRKINSARAALGMTLLSGKQPKPEAECGSGDKDSGTLSDSAKFGQMARVEVTLREHRMSGIFAILNRGRSSVHRYGKGPINRTPAMHCNLRDEMRHRAFRHHFEASMATAG